MKSLHHSFFTILVLAFIVSSWTGYAFGNICYNESYGSGCLCDAQCNSQERLASLTGTCHATYPETFCCLHKHHASESQEFSLFTSEKTNASHWLQNVEISPILSSITLNQQNVKDMSSSEISGKPAPLYLQNLSLLC